VEHEIEWPADADLGQLAFQFRREGGEVHGDNLERSFVLSPL
jgi:hypothetical protein